MAELMPMLPLLLALTYAPHSAVAPPAVDHLDSAPAAVYDPLFGQGGSVTLATGVPFLAIGEAAWGFGDRFTMGALAGVTPNVLGVGLRPRVLVLDGTSDRLQLVAPGLYYPETSDGAPWVLTRPMVEWSHALGRGVRAGFGAGFVAATAVGADAASRPYAGAIGDARGITWWNAVSGHVVAPIGSGAAIFAEAAAILHGVRFAGDDWVGGPPFTISFGASAHIL